jgi:hypothetical protein
MGTLVVPGEPPPQALRREIDTAATMIHRHKSEFTEISGRLQNLGRENAMIIGHRFVAKIDKVQEYRAASSRHEKSRPAYPPNSEG